MALLSGAWGLAPERTRTVLESDQLFEGILPAMLGEMVGSTRGEGQPEERVEIETEREKAERESDGARGGTGERR
jgi:hypothetical protein